LIDYFTLHYLNWSATLEGAML